MRYYSKMNKKGHKFTVINNITPVKHVSSYKGTIRNILEHIIMTEQNYYFGTKQTEVDTQHMTILKC